MLLLISKDSFSPKDMFNLVETHDDWELYDKWIYVTSPSRLEDTTQITFELMEEWACGITRFYDEQYSDDCYFEIEGYSCGQSAQFMVRRVK